MACSIAEAFILPSGHLIPVGSHDTLSHSLTLPFASQLNLTFFFLPSPPSFLSSPPPPPLQLTEQPAGSGAQRPQNAQLDCSRLELLGLSTEPHPFKMAVRDCLWPFLYDKRWRQTVFH